MTVAVPANQLIGHGGCVYFARDACQPESCRTEPDAKFIGSESRNIKADEKTDVFFLSGDIFLLGLQRVSKNKVVRPKIFRWA